MINNIFCLSILRYKIVYFLYNNKFSVDFTTVKLYTPPFPINISYYLSERS